MSAGTACAVRLAAPGRDESELYLPGTIVVRVDHPIYGELVDVLLAGEQSPRRYVAERVLTTKRALQRTAESAAADANPTIELSAANGSEADGRSSVGFVVCGPKD